ncbi:hypothetical protein BH09ACT7_BH09ACT7_16130 [soil metagenome]
MYSTVKPRQDWFELLGTFDISGGDIQSESDALVTHTADGVNLNDLWTEANEVFRLWNQNLDSLTSLLTYRTVAPGELVLQKSGGAKFEQASEFGVPKGIGPDPAILIGSDFNDYDVALRLSWRYVRSATSQEIRNSINNIIAGHGNAISSAVLQRLFDNTQISTPEGNLSYGLWAADGKPLDYMGTSFAASHQHYLVSGAASLDSEDVESLQRLTTEHGYGQTRGSQLLLLCSENEAEVISSLRAGVANNNTKIAKYDFIPSAGAPAYLSSQSIVGTVAPGELDGIKVIGSYGRLWVVPLAAIPAGYLSVVATSGANSPANVISWREHPRTEYQGLRLIPGNFSNGYPLLESFASFSGGTGTRNRGAAAAMQVKESGSYEVPTIDL